MRTHRITVNWTQQEFARLQELRPESMSDSAFFRALLVLGPSADSPPMDVLRRAWSVYGDELRRPAKDGTRCWGEWAFDIGEERPATEQEHIIRLHQLGQLGAAEIEQVQERARAAIAYAAQADRLHATGAIKLGPRGLADEMRAERVEAAAAWRRVLAMRQAGQAS